MFIVGTVKVMLRFIRLPCSYKDDVEVCCLIWRQTDQSPHMVTIFLFLTVSCANSHYIRHPRGYPNSHTVIICISLFLGI